MSYYHNGWSDGVDHARGVPLPHDPHKETNTGYRHGFEAGQAFVAREHRAALATGLFTLVSNRTGKVHYAYPSPIEDAPPLCGETAAADCDPVAAHANCDSCIVQATWRIAAAKAEAVL